jgi:hypothetical protein
MHRIAALTRENGGKKQSEERAALFATRVDAFVYARHGREFMG